MEIDFVPDPALYPFTSRWFDSSAGRVHYVDEGVGPVLVFCHGSPTWSFIYRRIVAGLRDRFRCIAMDHLGFGLSERPEGFGYTISEHTAILGELVDRLRLDDFVVMGQDWGGPIGLGAAVARADRVRGTIVANTAFWPIEQRANRAFSAVLSSRFMQKRILDDNLLVERLLLGGSGPALTAGEAEHYRAVHPTRDARRGLAVMPREIRAAEPLLEEVSRSVPRELGDKPSLALWGMRDRAFRPRHCLPRVRESFHDLVVVELPDAGHFIQEEEPDQIVDAIRRRFG